MKRIFLRSCCLLVTMLYIPYAYGSSREHDVRTRIVALQKQSEADQQRFVLQCQLVDLLFQKTALLENKVELLSTFDVQKMFDELRQALDTVKRETEMRSAVKELGE